jgi:SPP1 gp7 family putative phage head morphogenesis protein
MPSANISAEDISVAFRLPAKEAVAYLSRKGYAITWSWDDLVADAHQQAFTVAKATSLAILKDIRTELERAQADGVPKETFIKRLEPILQSRGWWGKRELENPETGELEKVQLGSAYRLENIYRTNIQSAYQAGRFKEQTRNRARRPFGQYVAVGDRRSRPSHLRLNGKVLPLDSPFWRSNYPPNGYGCRCRVRTLSEREVKREGLQIATDDPDVTGFVPDKGFSGGVASAWEPDLETYPGDLREAYKDINKTREESIRARIEALRAGRGGKDV